MEDYAEEAMRSERLMRDAAERLGQNIKTDRGMRTGSEVEAYLAEQEEKVERYECMRPIGTAQPEGTIQGIKDALAKKWTPEQIKIEIISSHIRRIMAVNHGEKEEYLGLFGRCVGLCWLIKNEDNYEGRGA